MIVVMLSCWLVDRFKVRGRSWSLIPAIAYLTYKNVGLSNILYQSQQISDHSHRESWV